MLPADLKKFRTVVQSFKKMLRFDEIKVRRDFEGVVCFSGS